MLVGASSSALSASTVSDVDRQERRPFTVRLAVTGLAEIERMAEAEDRDCSSMIRILLREAIAARKAKNR